MGGNLGKPRLNFLHFKRGNKGNFYMKRLILASMFLALSASGLCAQSLKGPSTNIWQGPYAGVTIGGLFDYHELDLAGSTLSSVGSGGWTGGLVGGYDLALNRYLVGLWVEGNLEADSAKGNLGSAGLNVKALGDWSVGTRAGYIIWPNVLAYGKVGFTQASFETNLPGAKIGELSGVTYGAGFEYAITQNIFIRTEYRHENYLTASWSTKSGELTYPISDKATGDNVTIGISYKFNNGIALPTNILPDVTPSYKPLK